VKDVKRLINVKIESLLAYVQITAWQTTDVICLLGKLRNKEKYPKVVSKYYVLKQFLVSSTTYSVFMGLTR